MFGELRRDKQNMFIGYMIKWDEWGEPLVCDVELAYGRRMTGVPDHLLEKSCESRS